MIRLDLQTQNKTQLMDITATIQNAINRSGVQDGICTLFVPHTTAGITLNENWDPDVQHDILYTLDQSIASPDPHHRHGEGNSPAHIKVALVGSTTQVFVEQGKLHLGQWQGIYLAEFDGPRHRQVWMKVIPG